MTHAPSASSDITHPASQPHSKLAALPSATGQTDQALTTSITLIEDALKDVKAKNITTMNVENVTDVADRVIIASGTSSRHLMALADHVIEKAKKAGLAVLGTEGQEEAEWILVDLAGIVVHLMLPATRAFYDLESLWRDPTQEFSEALAS